MATKSFHQFRELPMELQDMIWFIALEEYDTRAMFIFSSKWDGANNIWTHIRLPQPFFDWGRRATRVWARKRGYRFRLVKATGRIYLRRKFDPQRDTTYLSTWDAYCLYTSNRKSPHPVMLHARYVALPAYMITNNPETVVKIVQQLPNMSLIMAVFGDLPVYELDSTCADNNWTTRGTRGKSSVMKSCSIGHEDVEDQVYPVDDAARFLARAIFEVTKKAHRMLIPRKFFDRKTKHLLVKYQPVTAFRKY